jgi:hypothetical protein
MNGLRRHLNLNNLRQRSPGRAMVQHPLRLIIQKRTPEQWQEVMKRARKVCSEKLIYIADDPRGNMSPNRASKGANNGTDG